jgi:hypothetical protein
LLDCSVSFVDQPTKPGTVFFFGTPSHLSLEHVRNGYGTAHAGFGGDRIATTDKWRNTLNEILSDC